jgi:hypothetical protein
MDMNKIYTKIVKKKIYKKNTYKKEMKLKSMKQNITIEQLKELNKNQLQKLWNLIHCPYLLKIAYSEKYKLDTTKEDYNKAAYNINIGQMIEILEESCSTFNIIRYDDITGEQWNIKGTLFIREKRYLETLELELCDALWEGVKIILEK